jgi:octaprenyl-diphosphate synthase
MMGHRATDADLVHATSLLRETGGLDDTLARARHYGQRAVDALGAFPASAAKSALTEAVAFAVARVF